MLLTAPPTLDGIVRDQVDLDGYVPAWANTGYLVTAGEGLVVKCPPGHAARRCDMCETRWRGVDACFICDGKGRIEGLTLLTGKTG